MTKNNLCKLYDTEERFLEIVDNAEKLLYDIFDKYENIKEHNFLKVLHAMKACNLNYSHFYWNTGYGYNDPGREKAEEVYSSVFNTEDALVRPNIVSGTHAIYLTLSGLLKSGDHLLSISGKPYDTLLTVIGIAGNEANNLIGRGIDYSEIPLKNNDFDIEKITESIKENTRVIMLQRSTGYSSRSALSIEKIRNVCSFIKKSFSDIIIAVDNCYGEFVETDEPSDAGADIVMGSLIKNPGGGLALTGGYICGKKTYISAIANRLTAPGIGKDVGLTFGHTRNIMQGLYFAPQVTVESLKGSILAAKVYEGLGYNVIPGPMEERSDIIQAIEFNDPGKLKTFCQAVQSASPVDSSVTLYADDMPGYTNKIIMASGAFVQGSSIELSADAPMREPYIAYLQGGLSYYQCKYAVIKSLENILGK